MHRTLYRIEALVDLPQYKVKKGDLGGYIESYNNLIDSAWVEGSAFVCGDAQVSGNAKVSCKARVYGNARVYDSAEVFGNAHISDSAQLFGNSHVYGVSKVYGNSQVFGYACVSGNSRVFENAQVYGNSHVYGNAKVYGDTQACGASRVFGNSEVPIGHAEKPSDVRNIVGERYNVTILPEHIKIGCQLWNKDVWWNFTDRDIIEMDGKEGLKWWNKWKPILMAMCDTEE
jgi:carbonic anhydrase/acetyltransferase-like protein (isoleucine patch superfamily)